MSIAAATVRHQLLEDHRRILCILLKDGRLARRHSSPLTYRRTLYVTAAMVCRELWREEPAGQPFLRSAADRAPGAAS